MATLDERIAALLLAGRSGQGGGLYSHRVIDAFVATALRDIARLLGLSEALTREELLRVLAGRLARHKTSAWETSRAYGVMDARTASSGPTYLPWVPAGYEMPPDDFIQTAPEFTRDPELDGPEDAYDRLVISFDTTLVAGPDGGVRIPEDRVNRLIENEVAESAVQGYQSGGRVAGARGYRRRINPDACQLCFWLWKGGYVYPIDQPMHRHVGCRCYPEYTTDRVGRWTGTEEENFQRSEEEQRFLEIYPSKGSPRWRELREETREQRDERIADWRRQVLAGRAEARRAVAAERAGAEG